MVDYSEWIEAVNEAYKSLGGTYGENTAARLIEEAAAFWQRNKEELKTIAYREAVRIAERELQ